jgi:hypothetical protein
VLPTDLVLTNSFRCPLFQTVVAFARCAFTPHVAPGFVIDLITTWLRHRGTGTLHVLSQHVNMGMHTDILFFQAAKYDVDGGLLRQKQVLRCVYSHPTRPFGYPVPACPDCRLMTLARFSFTPTWIVLKCRRCNIRFAYERPQGLCWMLPWPKKGELAHTETWLMQVNQSPKRRVVTEKHFFSTPHPQKLDHGASASNLAERSATPLV